MIRWLIAVLGVALMGGCAAPPSVDYQHDQPLVVRESPASGRCDLYTRGGSLVASKTILAGEPIGFRKVGTQLVALAGPYAIPVAAGGDYAWVVVEAQSPVRIPAWKPSAYHIVGGVRSRIR
jgi:hypothetical protein